MRQAVLYMYLGKVSYLGYKTVADTIVTKANNLSFGHGFNSRKMLYVVRHPLDVVVSYRVFRGESIENAIDVILTGTPLWLSWADHVKQMSSHRNEVLICRFEDYGEEQLKRVAEFLSVEYIDGMLDELAFDKIKKEQDRQHNYRDRGGTVCCSMNANFLWTGESNKNWGEWMSAEQINTVLQACAPAMEKLGYYD